VTGTRADAAALTIGLPRRWSHKEYTKARGSPPWAGSILGSGLSTPDRTSAGTSKLCTDLEKNYPQRGIYLLS